MKNTMKALVVAAAGALTLAGCGSSPEAVVKDFWIYADAGKTEKAVNLILPQRREALGDAAMRNVARFGQMLSGCGGVGKVDVQKKSGNGDRLTFTVKTTFKGDAACKENRDTMRAVKFEGRWYVAPPG